jgi:hypothetical protein
MVSGPVWVLPLVCLEAPVAADNYVSKENKPCRGRRHYEG